MFALSSCHILAILTVLRMVRISIYICLLRVLPNLEYHNVANKTLLMFYYFNELKTYTAGFVHTISGRNKLWSNDHQDLFVYFLANTTLLLRNVTLTVNAPQQL